MSKINSTDIANILNISQASISRAFNKNSSMTHHKRRAILKCCIENSYRRDKAKIILETENPTRIAFLLNELHNPFFSWLLNAFSEVISQHKQYRLEIHIVQNKDEDSLRDLLSSLKRSGVEGIIAASLLADSQLPYVTAEMKIPLIAINRSIDHKYTSCVTADNYKNAYRVAEILHKKGHTNFTFISDNKRIGTIKDRLDGIMQYIKDNDIAPLHIIQCDTSYDGAYEETTLAYKALMKNKTTAVIGGNDIMAIGAMDSLRHENNISVPQNIAFMGFDDIPMASWKAYQLSTVRQRVNLMSREAFETLEIILTENVSGLLRKSQGKIILRSSV